MDIAVSHTFDTHSQRNQGRRACLQGQPCKYLRIDGAAPLTAATARAGSHRIGPRIRERRQGSGPHPIICRAPPPRHRQGERASLQATDSPPRCRSTIAARSIGDRDAAAALLDSHDPVTTHSGCIGQLLLGPTPLLARRVENPADVGVRRQERICRRSPTSRARGHWGSRGVLDQSRPSPAPSRRTTSCAASLGRCRPHCCRP